MDPRLHQAARLGDLAALKLLLEEDPLLLEKVALSPSADTPLHVTTLAAKTDFAKEILLRMPNFAWELNQEGFSPLHIAAAMGNIEITRELLSLGPGLCLVKDKLGRTPLHWAARETALHLAVKNNQFEVLKVLVEKLGEDDRDQLINAQDDQGNTISKLAVAKGLVKAQKLLKNQSKQDKEVAEVSPQDVQNQELQTNQGTIQVTDPYPLHQQPNESKRQAEAMILVVVSLIATVTYQAGLAPPPTIWKQDMKLDFNCMFRTPPEISLEGPPNTCPAFTYYLFMSFNTAGFCSSIFLLFSYRDKAFVAALLPTTLTCMVFTYITLSLTMSPNAITFLMIYLITIMIFVYILIRVKAIQAMLQRASSAGGKVVSKLVSKLRIKRQSSDRENDSKI
ncbi:Ankyrin repeat-containing protein BDA1 [Vitis vinifera]|uniref:Ankyrin repeat-containing protein BDA1 n=1 Tax=Vitis vinifera TaxID=29760 RepID=A0A438CYB5_VITVI|nr:Ankyrin repeat-containing protein BDA1 [Vitis vinifera]